MSECLHAYPSQFRDTAMQAGLVGRKGCRVSPTSFSISPRKKYDLSVAEVELGALDTAEKPKPGNTSVQPELIGSLQVLFSAVENCRTNRADYPLMHPLNCGVG